MEPIITTKTEEDVRSMTIKDITQLTGKTTQTIRNWVVSASNGVVFTTSNKKEPKIILPLHQSILPIHQIISSLKSKVLRAQDTNAAQDFTIDEVILILQAGGSETLARLLFENYRQHDKDSFALVLSDDKTKKEMMLMSNVVAPMIKETLLEIFKPLVDGVEGRFSRVSNKYSELFLLSYKMKEDMHQLAKTQQVTLNYINSEERKKHEIESQSIRDQIHALVNEYNLYTGIEHQICYRIIYNNLYDINKIHYVKEDNDSKIVTIEKYDLDNQTNWLQIALAIAKRKFGNPVYGELYKENMNLRHENEILKDNQKENNICNNYKQ